MGPGRRESRERAGRAALALAATLFALGVAEIAARALVDPPQLLAMVPLDEERHAATTHFLALIESDPELFWRLAPDVVLDANGGPWVGRISNAQGLREAAPVPRARPADEVRVLFVGDSRTFGWGVALEDAIPDQVERQLAHALPGLRVDCINAGVPGWSLFQGWRYLETEGFAYEPDLVVLNFGWNDLATWSGRSDREHYDAWQAAQPPAALRWSRLAQAAWAAAALPLPPADAPRQRVTPKEFRDLLDRIGEAAADRGADLLLLVGAARPNLDPKAPRQTPLQAEQLRWGSRHHFGPDRQSAAVSALPIARRLAARHGIDAVFSDQVHFTALANRAVASAVAQRIAPWARRRQRDR